MQFPFLTFIPTNIHKKTFSVKKNLQKIYPHSEMLIGGYYSAMLISGNGWDFYSKINLNKKSWVKNWCEISLSETQNTSIE